MDSLRSLPLVDLIIIVALFGAFILGVMQGSIRRLLGIISVIFAFLVAANLRDTVGDMLASNWKQFPVGYNRLLAFLLLWAILTIVISILIQGFYKRTDIYARKPIVADIIGGLLGLLEGVIVLLILIIILNSYILPAPQSGDVDQLRSIQKAILYDSNIAGGLRDSVVPTVVHLLAVLLPADVVKPY